MRSALFLVFLVSSVISRRPSRGRVTRPKAPVRTRSAPQINQRQNAAMVTPQESRNPAIGQHPPRWGPPTSSKGASRDPSTELSKEGDTRSVTNGFHRAHPRQRGSESTPAKADKDLEFKPNQIANNKVREDGPHSNEDSHDRVLSELSKSIEENRSVVKNSTPGASNPKYNEAYTALDLNRTHTTDYNKDTEQGSERYHHYQDKNNLIDDHESKNVNLGEPLQPIDRDVRYHPYNTHKVQMEQNKTHLGTVSQASYRQINTNYDSNHDNPGSNKVPNNDPSMGHERDTQRNGDNTHSNFQNPETNPGMNQLTDSGISSKRDGDLNSRDRDLDLNIGELNHNNSPTQNPASNGFIESVKGINSVLENFKPVSELITKLIPDKPTKNDQKNHDSVERNSSNLREEHILSPTQPNTDIYNDDASKSSNNGENFANMPDRIQSNLNENKIIGDQDEFHQLANSNSRNNEPDIVPSEIDHDDNLTKSSQIGSYPEMEKMGDRDEPGPPPFDMAKSNQLELTRKSDPHTNQPELIREPNLNNNQPELKGEFNTKSNQPELKDEFNTNSNQPEFKDDYNPNSNHPGINEEFNPNNNQPGHTGESDPNSNQPGLKEEVNPKINQPELKEEFNPNSAQPKITGELNHNDNNPRLKEESNPKINQPRNKDEFKPNSTQSELMHEIDPNSNQFETKREFNSINNQPEPKS